jgi:hypothetical protein
MGYSREGWLIQAVDSIAPHSLALARSEADPAGSLGCGAPSPTGGAAFLGEVCVDVVGVVVRCGHALSERSPGRALQFLRWPSCAGPIGAHPSHSELAHLTERPVAVASIPSTS